MHMPSPHPKDPTRQVSLFILAGEASGDIIGADLIAKMRAQVSLKLAGVGDSHMIESGLKSLFPATDLAVMGYVDVIMRLPLLLWRVRQTVRHILKTKPDIVVLIDSQVFSNLVARGLKKHGFGAPVLLYVAPTVWGYKPERARHIVPLYDEVLAILPFEPPIMKQLGGPKCRYVGHPALERLQPANNPDAARIILMPGSRTGELKRHLHMFKMVSERLSGSQPDLEFVLVTLPRHAASLTTKISNWKASIVVASTKEERAKAFASCRLAITVAGTATLELAVADIPMVVSYVMDVGQIQLKKKLDVKHFALPNLILDQPVVPELLFEKPDAERLFATTRQILANPDSLHKQKAGFARMRQKMKNGTDEYPRHNPATCVLSHLNG